MAQVSSNLPGAPSLTHRYRNREGDNEDGQKIDAIESKMESSSPVKDTSLYSYHGSEDLSGFLKEFNGR
jgi:hypothetical protein